MPTENLKPIENTAQQVYTCELDPETKTTLHVHLYKNVKNVEQIRNNILSGSWKCVMIKPALIQDPLQIAAAANRAVLAEKHNKMTTRSVYTEILFNLSLSKNISQSLSKFGIGTDTEMLLCFLKTPSEDNSKEILDSIQGEVCSLDALASMSDVAMIQNAYKVKQNLQCNIDPHEMLNMIISRIAAKNIISF